MLLRGSYSSTGAGTVKAKYLHRLLVRLGRQSTRPALLEVKQPELRVLGFAFDWEKEEDVA